MAEISAALVKELREQTGAGMMDCKKALSENDGDLESAVDWLRKEGLAAAAKKAGRIASEGLVGVAVAGKRGSVVEVNAETDFVARNDGFQDFVENVTAIAAGGANDLETLKAAEYPGAGKVEEALSKMIATVGENMDLRRCESLEVGEGVVSSYVHNALRAGLGKIGVLVALESSADPAKLDDIGKQLAMHVAATSPLTLTPDSLDKSDLDRERSVLSEQARASGKPDDIVEKMVAGRLRKFYEEVCLLEQIYVIDGETKVGKVIAAASKDLGAEIKVSGFVRFALGEGIEKKQQDFASEVAATLGG